MQRLPICSDVRKNRSILAVNKVDDFNKYMADVYEFYNLGIGDPVPVSAASRLGIGDLLDEVIAQFPQGSATDEEDERPRIAIVGKPNVGKSSDWPSCSVSSVSSYPILRVRQEMRSIQTLNTDDTLLTEQDRPIREDFPTFGFPTIAILGLSSSSSVALPCGNCAMTSSSKSPIPSLEAADTGTGSPIAQIEKIHRHLPYIC